MINKGILKKVGVGLTWSQSLKIVSSTVLLLNNMLVAPSSQLVDVFCRDLLPVVVEKWR